MCSFPATRSASVRQDAHSPGLVAVLRAACDDESVSRKEIARAADFSLATAYRIVDHGWREYDQVQGLIDRLPEGQSLAIASDLCRRFTVSVREADGRGVGVGDVLKLAGETIDLGEAVNDADRDQVRTAEERADIQQRINEIRARLDRIEAANAAPVRRRA